MTARAVRKIVMSYPRIFSLLLASLALNLSAADAPEAPAEKKADVKPAVNPTATPVHPSTLPAIDKGELLGHIKYLSSEELRGREAGTPEQLKAAEYIAGEFKRYGLEPFGDEKDGSAGYLQEFPIKVFKGAGKDAAFKFTLNDKETTGEMKKDFVLIPAGYKRSKGEGGVAFAGYGILAPDYNYDDFANLDLAGKWAIVLRYHPQEFQKDAIFKNATKYAALQEKVKQCALRRAVGVLIVTGPVGREKEKESDQLARNVGGIIGDFKIPVLHITQSVANQLLAPAEKTIGDLQAAINKDLSNQSLSIPNVKVSAVSDIEVIEKKTYNIIARLSGSDEKLKNEYVVVGAHCDHVGMGYDGSLLGKEGHGKMHPGADDNASGTSGVLEIAQYMGAMKREERPKRSIIFMAFSGEEKGLLGSQYYCEHPKVPLTETISMVNLDMIGRSAEGNVTVSGMSSCKSFKELVTKDAADSKLKVHLGGSSDGPSDHASFYKKKLPVIFFNTSTHEDYHRPSDTWDRINAPAAAEIANIAAKVVVDLANCDERPKFNENGGNRSYLGVGVDEKAKNGPAFLVGSVGQDSPAEKAGIKVGDLILSLNQTKLAIPMDLNMNLMEFSAGDEVEFEVKRGTENLKFKVTLAAPRPRAPRRQ